MSLARFTQEGEVVFIYEDGHPLMGLGNTNTARASQVEPTKDGGWQADMAPVHGPKLKPTSSRKASLAQEQAWIRKNLLQK